VALALLVLWGQIRLVVSVGRGDDLGRGVAAAVLWALVATVRVRVNGILGWVVTAFVCAVAAINGVQEVVEGCTFNEVADLVESDLLGIHERHSVLKIQIALSIESEAHVRLLKHTTINAVQDRPVSNLRFRKVAEEQVQVTRHVGLRTVLNDTITVFGVCFVVDGELVERSQAVGRDVRVTVGKVVGWLVLLHEGVRSVGLRMIEDQLYGWRAV